MCASDYPFVVSREFVPCEFFKISIKLVKAGTRLFQQSAKLEISGILRDDTKSRLNARLKEKLKQVSESDDGLPGCAIVVEFSNFVAKVAWNNE